MTIGDLVPSLWRKNLAPARTDDDYPFLSLQKEINHLFDDFFRGFGPSSLAQLTENYGVFAPAVDIKDNDHEIVVKAELPGIDEKDLEVTLADDTLTIRGEKKEEKEEKGKNYYTMERSYGTFHRVLPLPAAVDKDKTEARFKNGILTLTLKKLESKPQGKKISIKTE